MTILREPPEHFTALHAAEAAFRAGDKVGARRLFRLAEIASESLWAKMFCRQRREAFYLAWDKPRWSYRALSNVRLDYDYDTDRVSITADVPDLPYDAAATLVFVHGEDELEYEPAGCLDDGEFDPALDSAAITVYGKAPLDARKRLAEVSTFLVDLAARGDIDECDCFPQFRAGDALLLRHIQEKRAFLRMLDV